MINSGSVFILSPVSPPLSVDREGFLLLTAALAASHCLPTNKASSAPEHGSQAVPENGIADSSGLVVAIPKPDPSAVLQPAQTDEPPPEPPEPSCDNDQGVVSCDFIDHRFGGPACEAFVHNCRLYQQGSPYRLRVAEKIAQCWKRAGPAACGIWVRKKCIRESFKHACSDPSLTPACEDAIKRCQKRGQRPRFTVSECVAALSSMPQRELEWAKGATGPSREGCKLMFPVY